MRIGASCLARLVCEVVVTVMACAARLIRSIVHISCDQLLRISQIPAKIVPFRNLGTSVTHSPACLLRFLDLDGRRGHGGAIALVPVRVRNKELESREVSYSNWRPQQ